MFNKNTTYLIPQVSSSTFHPRCFDVNGVEILLHHHHHDVFSGHFSAPIMIGSSSTVQELEEAAAACATTVTQKHGPVKKDRHSKIYTSQGPRDRRVRLSIGIARKFFDLQETLGFDKPSKTLDWLFTKSKAAIKDLVQSKQKGTTSSSPDDTNTTSSPSQCELLSSAEDYNSKKMKKKKKKKDKDSASYDLAKESRAKARARARERTREKMCIKQLNGAGGGGARNINNGNCNAGYNGTGFREDNILHCPSLPNEDSLVIKRKAKSPSFFGFQQNGFVSSSSRDHLSSNYITPSANATDHQNNWDNVCNFTSQSNLYAILDHHKFINSNSNI